MGALVFGGDVLFQIPSVITAVTAIIAREKLLAALLGVVGPGLLGGGLQMEGEEGRQGGGHTGGGLGGGTPGLGSYTGRELGGGHGAAGELGQHGVVLQLFGQL